MTITVSRIANSGSFGTWLERTNQIADIMTSNALTADSSSNGSVTTGNAAVNGHLSANVLIATGQLRGGNTSTALTLNISSNAVFVNNSIQVYANTTATRVVIASNVYLGNTSYGYDPNGNFTANSVTSVYVNVQILTANTITLASNLTANAASFSGLVNIANSANISGNMWVGGDLAIAGNTTVSGPIVSGGNTIPAADDTFNQGNNSNRFIIWGSNVNVSNTVNYGRPTVATATTKTYTFTNTSLQTVDTFAIATYRSAEYLVQMANATAFQISKLLAVHDGTNAYVTEYGIVNNGTSMGIFSANIITGSLSLQCAPTSNTITAKIFKTMVVI